jgi:RNA polymerase sigma-70 factor (ECF subfamily)
MPPFSFSGSAPRQAGRSAETHFALVNGYAARLPWASRSSLDELAEHAQERLGMHDDENAQQTLDQAWIEAAAKGDEEAFGRLYDRLSGPLYTLCLRMLGDASEAEDALQEGFLQLWRNAARYDAAQSSVFGWAMHITRCKVIDRLRARGRRLRLYVPEEGSEGIKEPVQIASEDAGAADSATRNECSVSIRRTLQDLPDDQRQAIELAFFGDLTHHEIAARLGQPLGSVKARIRRGLMKLRGSLEKWL